MKPDYEILSFYTLVTEAIIARWLKNPVRFVPPDSTITGFFLSVDRRFKNNVASWTNKSHSRFPLTSIFGIRDGTFCRWPGVIKLELPNLFC